MSGDEQPRPRVPYSPEQRRAVRDVIGAALAEHRKTHPTRRNRFEVTADRLGDDLERAAETLDVSGSDRDAIGRVRYVLQCWARGEES